MSRAAERTFFLTAALAAAADIPGVSPAPTALGSSSRALPRADALWPQQLAVHSDAGMKGVWESGAQEPTAVPQEGQRGMTMGQ